MKKPIAILLTSLLALSLTACSGAPSEEKIKTALEDGTITVKDAKAKGWIDDAWIKANFKQIEAKSKIHLFDPFETTYLDGTPASSNLIEGKMCLVFFNTEEEATLSKLDIYNDITSEMKELGVPIIGIITDNDSNMAKDKLKDIKFPVIVYNEEMQTSLKDYSGLIDEDIVSVFTKEGGFYTAWNSKGDKEDVLEFASVLADEK